jgi:aspartate racemase
MQNVGILGGLGPEATQLLFKKIIDKTPAKCDQEHIPIIIYNNPQIPDRTKAILYGEESPLPELIKTAKILEFMGAKSIVIPCNTAHYFIDRLQMNIKIPIIDMIKETVLFIKQNYPETTKIGLISTTGTIASRIYHNEFNKIGVKVITPDSKVQENKVMDSIYGKKGIKAGFHKIPQQKIEKVGQELINNGAEIIIAGCTEISIVLKQKRIPYVVINPLSILAEKAIEFALIPEVTQNQTEIIVSKEKWNEAVLEICEEEE